jgi:hypothetical protein
LRGTQFHEFAGIVVAWTRKGQVAVVPPLLVQPVAAADVGDALGEIAAGAPQGRVTDLAGPEPQDLVDMARRTLSARGESIRLIPSWRTGLFGVEAAGEMLLPGPEARLAPTTFDAWLQGAERESGLTGLQLHAPFGGNLGHPQGGTMTTKDLEAFFDHGWNRHEGTAGPEAWGTRYAGPERVRAASARRSPGYSACSRTPISLTRATSSRGTVGCLQKPNRLKDFR